MNLAVVAFVASLLLFHAHGFQVSTSGNCLCLNGFIESIHPKFIRTGPVVHRRSLFCPNTEIIITTIKKREVCLNPNGQLGKLILRNFNRREAAARTTGN